MGVHKWRCSQSELDLKWAGTDAPAAVKVLGVIWQIKDDQLGVQIEMNEVETLTKRMVLTQLGQLYDPVGIAGPVVCAFKLVMQQLTITQKEWDSPVPGEVAIEFNKLKSYLHLTTQFRVPRCIGTDISKFALATFCDASTKAYGAVVYAVILETKERVLIASRSRLNSVKQFTVPRAELMAAVIGAELNSRILKWTGIVRFAMFTDATTVLAWIATHENRLEVFIRNRVKAIRSVTATHQWNHVPTAQNPADVLSRGANAKQLLAHKLWWNGPDLLETFPEELFTSPPEQQVVSMVSDLRFVAKHLPDKGNERYFSFVSTRRTRLDVSASEQSPATPPVETRGDSLVQEETEEFSVPAEDPPVPEPTDTAMIRNHSGNASVTCAGLLWSVRHWLIWKRKKFCSAQTGVIELYKRMQNESFADEIARLKAGKGVRPHSKLHGKDSFLDSFGILRFKTRIQTQTSDFRAPLALDASHP